MKKENNPLLCDIKTGVCETPTTGMSSSTLNTKKNNKPLKIVYFTDPICSSCWGIEPQLRKLKMEYGHAIDIEYHMGGLLPDWSYNSGGISKPSDVAHHWDDVSAYYQMPIDGDIWLEDPLHSSYPPSIAFKAAQIQDEQKALTFLRKIREMVFLHKKNITRWSNLEEAAKYAGLNIDVFKADYENKAHQNFKEDLALSKAMGVRGFPTLFLSNNENTQTTIYGFRPYQVFKDAINKLTPQVTKSTIEPSWEYLFKTHKTLTTKEYAVLSEQTFEDSKQKLEMLYKNDRLEKIETKNGNLWVFKY